MTRVLVALDFPNAHSAVEMARSLVDHVDGFKVGLELVMAEGPDVISRVASLELPVMADVKLHDIPNTAGAAARGIAAHGPRWVTAHAAGGRQMLEAVAVGLGADCGLLAVTVLTSLDSDGLKTVGVDGPAAQVRRLASLATAAGAEGVVCSVAEVGIVKEIDQALLAVTPGIRFEGSEPDDQRRVAAPSEAVKAGSDLLVVGRAVTGADDPVGAARAIAASLAEG